MFSLARMKKVAEVKFIPNQESVWHSVNQDIGGRVRDNILNKIRLNLLDNVLINIWINIRQNVKQFAYKEL